MSFYLFRSTFLCLPTSLKVSQRGAKRKDGGGVGVEPDPDPAGVVVVHAHHGFFSVFFSRVNLRCSLLIGNPPKELNVNNCDLGKWSHDATKRIAMRI